jgi:hypothetical protein
MFNKSSISPTINADANEMKNGMNEAKYRVNEG